MKLNFNISQFVLFAEKCRVLSGNCFQGETKPLKELLVILVEKNMFAREELLQI